ncbi:MAG: hypothetical protein V3U52_02075 [Thermoplasmata archaeon]
MPLPPQLAALLEPRRRPFIYIPAATGLSFLVLVAIPLFSILIAVFFMFAIPYWMGEKRPRNLVLAALVMLLATVIVLSSFFTWDLYRPHVPEQRSDGGILSAGTVNPVHGDADTTFTFTVLYTNSDPPSEAPRVSITSTFSTGTVMNETMELDDPSSLSYEEGVLYTFSTKLNSDAHYFRFAVLLADDTWVVSSDASSPAPRSRGPVNMPASTFFGNVAFGLISFTYLLIGIPLFLVIGIYAWRRRRKAPS